MHTQPTSLVGTPEPNEQEVKWVPEPIWTLWRREEFLSMPDTKPQVLWHPVHGTFAVLAVQATAHSLY